MNGRPVRNNLFRPLQPNTRQQRQRLHIRLVNIYLLIHAANPHFQKSGF
jgi:hypothetical protein